MRLPCGICGHVLCDIHLMRAQLVWRCIPPSPSLRCRCVCVYVCVRASLCFVCKCVRVFVTVSVSVTKLGLCLCLCLFLCCCLCLSGCLSVYLSIYLSVCLSVYLSVHLSVYLSVRVCVYNVSMLHACGHEGVSLPFLFSVRAVYPLPSLIDYVQGVPSTHLPLSPSRDFSFLFYVCLSISFLLARLFLALQCEQTRSHTSSTLHTPIHLHTCTY